MSRDLHFLGDARLKTTAEADLPKVAYGTTSSFGDGLAPSDFAIENADVRLTAWLSAWAGDGKKARDIYVRRLFDNRVLILSGAQLSVDPMGAWLLSVVRAHHEDVA